MKEPLYVRMLSNEQLLSLWKRNRDSLEQQKQLVLSLEGTIAQQESCLRLRGLGLYVDMEKKT